MADRDDLVSTESMGALTFPDAPDPFTMAISLDDADRLDSIEIAVETAEGDGSPGWFDLVRTFRYVGTTIDPPTATAGTRDFAPDANHVMDLFFPIR